MISVLLMPRLLVPQELLKLQAVPKHCHFPLEPHGGVHVTLSCVPFHLLIEPPSTKVRVGIINLLP